MSEILSQKDYQQNPAYGRALNLLKCTVKTLINRREKRCKKERKQHEKQEKPSKSRTTGNKIGK